MCNPERTRGTRVLPLLLGLLVCPVAAIAQEPAKPDAPQRATRPAPDVDRTPRRPTPDVDRTRQRQVRPTPDRGRTPQRPTPPTPDIGRTPERPMRPAADFARPPRRPVRPAPRPELRPERPQRSGPGFEQRFPRPERAVRPAPSTERDRERPEPRTFRVVDDPPPSTPHPIRDADARPPVPRPPVIPIGPVFRPAPETETPEPPREPDLGTPYTPYRSAAWGYRRDGHGPTFRCGLGDPIRPWRERIFDPWFGSHQRNAFARSRVGIDVCSPLQFRTSYRTWDSVVAQAQDTCARIDLVHDDGERSFDIELPLLDAYTVQDLHDALAERMRAGTVLLLWDTDGNEHLLRPGEVRMFAVSACRS